MRNSALIQLLARNRAAASAARPQAQATRSGDDATLYLYGPIVGDRDTAEWSGGACPQDMVPLIHSLRDASTLHLRINSPGGDFFGGQAISTALREHPGRVVAHVDGVAASAATVICCAAREVIASRGSQYMIHQAWTLAMGNADDLRATIALLEQVDGTIADEYARVSGASVEQVRAWMAAETWFTARQALDAGLITSIAEDAAPSASASWDLSIYQRAPEAEPTASDDHRARQRQRINLMRARYTAA